MPEERNDGQNIAYPNWAGMTGMIEANKVSEISEQDQIKELSNKLDRIERKLSLIFGDHVLINGQWIDTGKLCKK